jgi:hypothetical protein
MFLISMNMLSLVEKLFGITLNVLMAKGDTLFECSKYLVHQTLFLHRTKKWLLPNFPPHNSQTISHSHIEMVH